MTRRSLLGFFTFAALAASGWARSPALHNFFVHYHFTAQAHGKAVRAVYVHTGVLMANPDSMGGDAFWVDVKHSPMTRQGDHFVAKEKLQAWSHPGGPQAQRPVVQYWVYFEDGTHRKTRDLGVDVDRHVYPSFGRSYVDALGGAEHEWRRRPDTEATGGWEVTAAPRDR